MDNVQWDTTLRSVSAHRSFRWAVEGDNTAPAIAKLLSLGGRMPRSLAFCISQIVQGLRYLAAEYDEELPNHATDGALRQRIKNHNIGAIFEKGLHEFIGAIITPFTIPCKKYGCRRLTDHYSGSSHRIYCWMTVRLRRIAATTTAMSPIWSVSLRVLKSW